MGEVKTLVTLVLGGMFDHNELGDIDIIHESYATEALQRELVTGVDDVHVELVSRIDYDALMQRNLELTGDRDELIRAMEVLLLHVKPVKLNAVALNHAHQVLSKFKAVQP